MGKYISLIIGFVAIVLIKLLENSFGLKGFGNVLSLLIIGGLIASYFFNKK